jgi:hypothetical protein
MTTELPLQTDHLHFFNHHTGRPRFHFDEVGDAAAAAAASAAAAAAAAAKPWHETAGADAEILGHWQNKGLDITDPAKVAIEMTKQHRQAEKHFGVPVDRLLKLPDATAKPEEWAPVYQRLGAPKEAKEYDFAGIKFAGADLEAEFAEAMRNGLFAAGTPKDKAKGIVESVVKYLETADTAEATITAGKVATEKADLAKNWGAKFDLNMMQAKEGAKRAGMTEEAVAALEGQVGYAKVMELFRRIGASSAESVFHEGSSDASINTRTGAIAKLAELEADKGWGKKFKAGDATAKAEWSSLMAIINGEAA